MNSFKFQLLTPSIALFMAYFGLFGLAVSNDIQFNRNLINAVDKYYIYNILSGDSEMIGPEDEKKIKDILIKNLFGDQDKRNDPKPNGKICMWRLQLCREEDRNRFVVFANIDPKSLFQEDSDWDVFNKTLAMQKLQARFSKVLDDLD